MKVLNVILMIGLMPVLFACGGGGIDSLPDDSFSDEYDDKELWEIDFEIEVPERVRLEETNPNKYIVQLELWSTLPEILEGVSCKYGVRHFTRRKTNSGHWATDAIDYYLSGLDETTEHHVFDNFINEVDESYAMSYRVYNNLLKILASGEELTDSQRDLLENTKKHLLESIDSFKYDVFVEIYGECYPVNGSWQENVKPKDQ